MLHSAHGQERKIGGRGEKIGEEGWREGPCVNLDSETELTQPPYFTETEQDATTKLPPHHTPSLPPSLPVEPCFHLAWFPPDVEVPAIEITNKGIAFCQGGDGEKERQREVVQREGAEPREREVEEGGGLRRERGGSSPLPFSVSISLHPFQSF